MNNIILKSAAIDMMRYPLLAKYVKETEISHKDLMDALSQMYEQAVDYQWNMQEGWDEATLDSYIVTTEALKSSLGSFIPSISLVIEEFQRGLYLLEHGVSVWGTLGDFQTKGTDETIQELNERVASEVKDHIQSYGPFNSEMEAFEFYHETTQEQLDDIVMELTEGSSYGGSQSMINRYQGNYKHGDENFKSLMELLPEQDRHTGYALTAEAIRYFAMKARVTMYDPFEKGSLYPQTEVW